MSDARTSNELVQHGWLHIPDTWVGRDTPAWVRLSDYTNLRTERDQLALRIRTLECERDAWRGSSDAYKAKAERAADEPSSSAEERSNARRLQAYPKLAEFFNKYALGTKLPPSCFVCGDIVIDVGVQHMELLTVQCCKRCKDAADKARHAEPPPASPIAGTPFLELRHLADMWFADARNNGNGHKETCGHELIAALDKLSFGPRGAVPPPATTDDEAKRIMIRARSWISNIAAATNSEKGRSLIESMTRFIDRTAEPPRAVDQKTCEHEWTDVARCLICDLTYDMYEGASGPDCVCDDETPCPHPSVCTAVTKSEGAP